MIDLIDTIVAISTPPGRGGIGIVRLSGPESVTISAPLLRLRNPLADGRARFAQIIDPESPESFLDEAVITFHAAPNSYTTEDLVEIACHASPVLLDTLVRDCVARGARLAEPGEFTQRAFLAGRLDLTQAEAVHDLIASSTLHQARLAAVQLGGSLSRTIAPPKQRLVELIATLEAGVDFAEDDIDLLPQPEIAARIQALLTPLSELSATYAYGRIVREGFTLAIVGRPNAGKSSLFNRLLARDRAIVTAQPGTTRDAITETLSLDGIPVHLVDTAGLRTAPSGPEGEAERAGIARTNIAVAEADLILHVLNAADPEPPLEFPDLADRPHLRILNKSDLTPAPAHLASDFIATSALTGEGISALKSAILRTLTRTAPPVETPIINNLRQQQAITSAAMALAAALAAANSGLPHELLLLDLYTALQALDQLTGATSTDEILSLIFSTFCIGK